MLNALQRLCQKNVPFSISGNISWGTFNKLAVPDLYLGTVRFIAVRAQANLNIEFRYFPQPVQANIVVEPCV